jgi:predicted small secreted protein
MNMVKFKESFMQNSVKTALLALSLTLLAGCSTVTGSVDAVGQGVVSLGHKLQSMTGDVQVEEIEADNFKLSERFNEPVIGFDSFAMRAKAREVCPTGYTYQSRQATKAGEFATSHEQCAGTSSCTYTLEWRIKCEDVPYEPFTLFGKT